MSSMLEIRIDGLKELRTALRKYPAIAEPIVRKAFQGTGAIFAKHTTREEVPFKTGFLLQSFALRASSTSSLWFPKAKYAAFVELGTKPHKIEANGARALAIPIGAGAGNVYIGKSKGQRRVKVHVGRKSRAAIVGSDFLFRRSVMHPGTAPNPFMERIRDRSTVDVQKLFLQGYNMINREIAKQTHF